MNAFTDHTYLTLFVIGIISIILTTLVLVISKVNSKYISATNSFIFKFLKILLITTTCHSVGFMLNWVDDGVSMHGQFLCDLQSVILIFTCQNQEVWVACITMICYQGVVKRKYYSSSEHKYLFILSILFGILLPCVITLICLLFNATGQFGIYCWVRERNDFFIVLLYICKYLLIAFNLILSLILVIYVWRTGSSNEENKKMRIFCLKTLIIPIIQGAINIPNLILRLKGDKHSSIISSLQGIIHPLYIGWYAEIFNGCCQKKTKEKNDRVTDFQGKVGLIDINNRKTATTTNEINVQLITEVNNSGSLNNSLDYYA